MGLLDALSAVFGSDDSETMMETVLQRSGREVSNLEAKAVLPGVVASAVSSSTHPFLRGLPDDFGSRTRGMERPYRDSGWLQRAIKIISEPIESVPLRFFVPTSEGLKPVIDPDLAAFWERPAVGPGGAVMLGDVIAATVGWLKFAGECFWMFDESWMIPNAPKAPFFVASPWRTRPYLDGKGNLRAWIYRDAAGVDHLYLPEQVQQFKYWNPDDPIRGCPEWAGAKVTAEADAFMAEFMRTLMSGNGDRGQIISTKQAPTPEQKAQIEQAIAAKRANAARGLIRPLFLSADVTVSDPAIIAPDSEWVAARVDNRKVIYMMLGIPSSFAEQMPRATTAHTSDRYILVEDTCKPMSAKIAAGIATVSMRFKSLPLSGSAHVKAAFDWSQHSVMVQIRTERIEAAGKLWAMGMPFAKVNEFLGLQAPSFDGDDVGFISGMVQPLADVTSDIDGNKPATPPPKLPPGGGREKALFSLGSLLSLPYTGRKATVEVIENDPANPFNPAFKAGLSGSEGQDSQRNKDARETAWRRHMRARKPAEKMTAVAVRRVLEVQKGICLSKLDAKTKVVGTEGEAVTRAPGDDEQRDDTAPVPGHAIDILFDPEQFTTELLRGLDRVSKVNMQAAGQQVREELGFDDPWTMAPSDVLNALRKRENLLRSASADTFEQIKEELDAGFKAGETALQLAARVETAFEAISKGQAKTIAITETAAAYSAGRDAGAKSTNAKSKEWLSAHDKRVRPSHVAADGQWIGVEELFTVGADKAPHPAADSMSAAEACNCRCVCLYRLDKPPVTPATEGTV